MILLVFEQNELWPLSKPDGGVRDTAGIETNALRSSVGGTLLNYALCRSHHFAIA